VAGACREVQLYERPDRRGVVRLPPRRKVQALAFQPGAPVLVSAAAGLLRWDAASGGPLPGPKPAAVSRNVRALAFSPGGKHLAVAAPPPVPQVQMRYSLAVGEADDNTEWKQFALFTPAAVEALALDAEGRRVAAAHSDGN